MILFFFHAISDAKTFLSVLKDFIFMSSILFFFKYKRKSFYKSTRICNKRKSFYKFTRICNKIEI